MTLKTDHNGFTLIELIVVIMVASIFAAMMYQFVYTSSVRSPEPISVVGTSLKLHGILENITVDYSQNHVSTLNSLQPRFGAIEGSHQNNAYGAYRVIHNRFVKFVANSEQQVFSGDPEYGKLLKVTIESITSSERLTVLYYRQ